MISTFLQVLALCVGHSASPSLVVSHEFLTDAETNEAAISESYENPERATQSTFVFHPDIDYLTYTTLVDNMPNSEMGDYMLLLILSYLDFFENDNVVASGNDWVTTMDYLDFNDQSPTRFQSVYSNSMTSWITNYASSSSSIDPYEVPSGYPYYTYAYYYYFLSTYLADRGFTQATSSATNDFELGFARSNIGWLGNGLNTSIFVTETNANLAINAVANGWLAIFNPNQYNINLPFIVTGYEVSQYGSYISIYGYNPKIGTYSFSLNNIYEITVLNFHANHSHSNNLILDGPHYEYCGCGYHQCLDGHVFGTPVSTGATSHRYSCSNCDHEHDEAHEFHYERINALKHRKYCSVCGYSVLENHSGRWCICQLAD